MVDQKLTTFGAFLGHGMVYLDTAESGKIT